MATSPNGSPKSGERVHSTRMHALVWNIRRCMVREAGIVRDRRQRPCDVAAAARGAEDGLERRA